VFAKLCVCRVGRNHIYTVHIRCFWQGNHQIYSHIRCIYTVSGQPYVYGVVVMHAAADSQQVQLRNASYCARVLALLLHEVQKASSMRNSN
jgi:hypothetical protein